MSKRRDEKIKLLANALNGAAGSSFTVGVVGPLVAVFINLGDAASKVSSNRPYRERDGLAFCCGDPTFVGKQGPQQA